MQCPTVQIQTEPTDANPSGVVVVNAEDFDAKTMQLVDDDADADGLKSWSKDEVPAVPPASVPVTPTFASPPWAN